MMKTIRLILVMTILLIAKNLFGQDNRSASFTMNTSPLSANRNLSMAGVEESTSQLASSSWRGKHNIQLGIGLLSDYGVETETSTMGLVSTVSGDGFLGSISYSYWVQDNLAFGISVSIIGSEVSYSSSGSREFSEASSVVPVLFGIKHQPSMMAVNKGVRPYIFASVGPCIGSATRSFIAAGLSNETYTETALASHFGLGTDFVLGRLLVAGLSVGYYLATDFDRSIGGQKNYSSLEFTLSIGILLGGVNK